MIKNTDDAVWLTLASVWALGGILSWCYCLLSPGRTSVEASGLAAVAIMVSVVGLALRLPILTGQRSLEPSENDAESGTSDAFFQVAWSVMLLGLVANLNWLGTLALMSDSWGDFWPALVLVSLVEFWFCFRMTHEDSLSVPRELAAMGTVRFWGNLWAPSHGEVLNKAPTQPENAAVNSMAADGHAGINRDADEHDVPEMEKDFAPNEVADDGSTHRVHRSSTDGVDDQGQRFVTGTISSTLSEQQESEHLLVAFCPAFSETPQVEFEATHELIQLKLINVTQTGMRLEARRLAKETCAVHFEVDWYAVEGTSEELNERSITLP